MPDISKDAFSGIAGHAPVLKLLRSQLASGWLAHVYLFVGEPAVRKTAVATRLATALLPEAPLERHPDYWQGDRRDNLRIDEVRLRPDRQPEHHQHSLQALLSLKAAIGTYRVALISNVGRLADPIQGILVKTLEEPHPRRVIVLTTPSVSPFVVLPTVVSRCQRISFHAVQLTEVAALAAPGRSRGPGGAPCLRLAPTTYLTAYQMDNVPSGWTPADRGARGPIDQRSRRTPADSSTDLKKPRHHPEHRHSSIVRSKASLSL